MKKGFTLIEIMTALSVFLLVMTVSMGSIIGIFDTNRKSRSLKAVMSNLNLAVESMAREARFGRNYHCGSSAPLTSPSNCTAVPSSFVSFLSSSNEQIVYRLTGNTIEKSVDGGASYIAITSPEITVESLDFFVLGAGTSDNLQPKMLIKIKGYSGSNSKSRSDFALQTLVSQRAFDN
jgi:prepilin-type N-terminal cleavage/methylation domain-containing protein